MSDSEAARFIGGTMSRSMTWRAMMTVIGACAIVETSSSRFHLNDLVAMPREPSRPVKSDAPACWCGSSAVAE
jgi:hypothetical protein